MSVLAELMNGLDRMGPGSDAATLRVLGMLDDLPPEPRILDVGAGAGAQSLVLARALPGARITALDVNDVSLARLTKRAAQANLAGRITTHVGPMHAMDFPANAFDVIWSEGAAYIMGFANALRKWKPMLKGGGYLVASELTWLTVAPAADAQTFWDEAYPAMQTLEQNTDVAKEAGYELLATYILPGDAWQTEYYGPLEPRLAALFVRYPPSSREWKTLERMRREIDVFRAHGHEYGYVFYALRKP